MQCLSIFCNEVLTFLHPIYFHGMQDTIDVQNAWVIFQSADRFHLQGIRQKSKDKILIDAEKAFETRPLVRDELLEEVLVSDLMCITNEKLVSLLQKWDAPDPTNRWALVDRWVSPAKLPNRKCGESTADLLSCVRSRFDKFYQGQSFNQETRAAVYFANWVSVSFSLAGSQWLGHIYNIAAGHEIGRRLQAGDWIEWRLPKLVVHLIAIKFTEGLKNSDHLEVFCAADCSGWHCVFSSHDHDGVERGTVVKCGCDFLVQRFKVHMVSGDFPVSKLHFECILREV